MKIKCKVCGEIFNIPEGNCPICFSEYLAEINEISDSDKRFDELTEFINKLNAFDYDRGYHNAKCKNILDEVINCLNWEEVE